MFEQKVLFRVDFLSVTLGSMLQGGARGQKTKPRTTYIYFLFAFIFLVWNHSI